jgi:uncharacterized membrane protein YgcG
MEIGTAMEAHINDAKAGRMIDKYAIEHFKNNEFDQGLIELQDGTFKEISAMINGQETTVPEEEISWTTWIWIILFIFIIIFDVTDGFGTGLYISPFILGSSSSSGKSGGSSGFGGHSSGGGASRHF